MNQKWDSQKYTESFSFVHQYGNDVAGLIDMHQGNSILDLGCGNGALTARFHEQGLSVTGIDASEEMLQVARSRYPDIPFICADATAFRLDAGVDMVFSNAVLHWIEEGKQPDMIRCVYNALNDGGQFVFEMGGHGNNHLIHNALRESFQKRNLTYIKPFYFPTIGTYARLLEENGFRVTQASLFDRFTPLEGKDGLSDWIHMFVNRPFERVTDSVKGEIITETVSLLEPFLLKNAVWHADYVRLRMKAIKDPSFKPG